MKVLLLFIYLMTSTGAHQTSQNAEPVNKALILVEDKVTMESSTLIEEVVQDYGHLSEILAAIKENHTERLNELLKKQELMANDWSFVIREIRPIGNESVYHLSRIVNFGTNRLLVYIELWKLLQNSPVDENLTTQFNLFKEDLKLIIEILFNYGYVQKYESEAKNVLENIEWDKLAEAEVPFLSGLTISPIQSLWNESFDHVDLLYAGKPLIGEMENMNTNSEKIKVFKVIIYGAVLHATTKRNRPEYLFTLAYVIRNHIRNVYHETAKEYFNSYLKHLEGSLHGCIRTIVFGTSSNRFLIKNVQYGEYLVSKNDWSLYAINSSKPEPFTLTFLNHDKYTDIFRIRSTKYPNKYIVGTDYGYVSLSDQTSDDERWKHFVYVWTSKWDKENCNICVGYDRCFHVDEKSSDDGHYISRDKPNDGDDSFSWNFCPVRIK